MRWRDKFEEDLNIKGIRNIDRQWSQMNGGSQVPQQTVVLKEEQEEKNIVCVHYSDLKICRQHNYYPNSVQKHRL